MAAKKYNLWDILLLRFNYKEKKKRIIIKSFPVSQPLGELFHRLGNPGRREGRRVLSE